MIDIIFALTVIAAAFALYHRIQAGHALRRLAKLLEEQQAKQANSTAEPPRDEERAHDHQ